MVSREFTQPPPIGLAYAAAIAENAGHEAIIIDANYRPGLTKKQVLDRIRAFGADLLGFMLTAYMFRQTLDWIRYLKEKTGKPVVTGNILLDIYAAEIMTHSEIDYGVIGPAVRTLPALLKAIERNEQIGGMRGVCYRRGDDIIVNPPDTLREDFDILPFPARHLLPNHKYSTIISKKKNFTIMITSKGCTGKCGFCYIKNIPYSARSPERVVDEIEECNRKYGIREIEFFDPIFTLNKNRVIHICREIRKRNIKIAWACRARVDHMDEEMLDEMRAAGCRRIYYGVECGNQNILNNINKNITLKQVKDMIGLTKKRGILTLGFFLIGAPGDTVESIEETIKFALELDLDYAQFHKTMAKPAGVLYEQVKKYTGRDYWREYILGTAGEERLPSPWTEVSEEEIERLTVKAYRKFYFRPSRLFKIIAGIQSPEEFFRYVRSGIGMLMVKSDINKTGHGAE